MNYSKKTKNAEHLGLRFPISFLRMKNELIAKLISFQQKNQKSLNFYFIEKSRYRKITS